MPLFASMSSGFSNMRQDRSLWSRIRVREQTLQTGKSVGTCAGARSRGRLARLLQAPAVAFVIALPAQADIVPISDMLRGVIMTPAQCATKPQAVWLTLAGRDFCIRYYLSTVGGEGSRPVVLLYGDRLGKLNLKTGEFALTPFEKDLDTHTFVRTADSMSKQYKTTAIYIARPGIDGSSGDHRIRHTVLELNVTNAALAAIKQRHHFDGFHLIGHSGGSQLIGGILAQRSDIGCAVLGAGRLYRPERKRGSTDVMNDYFNAADMAAAIAQNSQSRVILVTDPEDKKVPEIAQTKFAQSLRMAGGQVEQFMVQATDENRHAIMTYSRVAAAGCLRADSTELIAQDLRRLVEKRLEAKAKANAAAGLRIDADVKPSPAIGQPGGAN